MNSLVETKTEIDNFVIIDDDYEMDMFKEHLVKLPSQMIQRQMGLDEKWYKYGY